jgi:hypothetical protein
MADAPKLKRVTRLDSVPLAEWSAEGFLLDKPIVTSCGVFKYTNPDGTIRRELRLPEHVFAPESLASYKGKPIILTHSAGLVTSENAPDEVIGATLSEGIPDGEAGVAPGSVRAEIVIHDTEAMKASGLKELSLGYNLTLDETPGERNEQPYDAVQTDIRINHLALVDKARAGEEARLNIDSKENQTNNQTGGKQAMAKKQAMNAATEALCGEMKKSVAAFEARRKARLDGEDEPSAIPEKIVIEGIVKPQEQGDPVSGATDSDMNPVTSEPAEGAPKELTLTEKVQEVKDRRDKRDGFGDPEDIEGAKGLIAQQDEDISVLLELLEKLQAAKDLAATPPAADNADANPKKDGETRAGLAGDSKPMNTDSVDAIVTERLKLARIGDKLNLDGLEAMKPLDAKKKIITKIKPNLRLNGKNAAYVDTAFDIAVQEFNSRKDTDYQRKQIFNADGRDAAKQTNASGASEARKRMQERIYNGGVE